MEDGKFKLGYVPELNGLRGYAIIFVMVFHTGRILLGGYIGVDIFFVLSGFLITSLLVQEYDSYGRVQFRNFYLRRVLRLAPALCMLLLIYSVLSFIFLDGDKLESNLIDSLIALFYSTNWARAFAIHPPDFLGHTWSLSIEEQFYIIWPMLLIILLRFVKSRRHIILIVASLAIAALVLRIYMTYTGYPFARIINGTDTKADALLTGCLLGLVLSFNLLSVKVQQLFAKYLRYITPACAIVLIYLGTAMRINNPLTYYLGFLGVELCTAVIILDIFISERGIIKYLLSGKIIVWIGSISYGLYLWHFPVFKTMQALHAPTLSVMTIGMASSFLLAAISYYCLEKPFLSMKKRLEKAEINNPRAVIEGCTRGRGTVNKLDLS
jgi:peptidoglycan/LPS O-acetylase OafA/YrhL